MTKPLANVPNAGEQGEIISKGFDKEEIERVCSQRNMKCIEYPADRSALRHSLTLPAANIP